VKKAQAKRSSIFSGTNGGSGMTSNSSTLPLANLNKRGSLGVNGVNGSSGIGGGGATEHRSSQEIQAALDLFLQEQERALSSVLNDVASLHKRMTESKQKINTLTDLIFQVQMEKEYFNQIGGELKIDEINKIFLGKHSPSR
jgi:chromosome segregation ATPase